MRHVVVLGTLLATVAPAAADPPQCRRWTNQLTVCEALGTGSSTNCTQVPVGIQNEQVNAQLYSAGALAACKKLIKKMNPAPYNYNPSKTIKACKWGSNPTDKKCYDMPPGAWAWVSPTTAWCVYDANNDTKINWDDASALGLTVSLDTVQPDDHCFCTVNGPHTPPAMPPYSGAMTLWESFGVVFQHNFPKGLKAAVLDHNFSVNGAYVSEAILASTGTSFDPEPNLQKDDPYADNAAEIDHIIPRVDSKGCLCGDPTQNNAAVISRELNASMLNISPKYNLARARMYEKYVTCPNPAAAKYQKTPAPLPRVLDQDQLDESSIEVETKEPPPQAPYRATYDETTTDETGGCSTGGAAGFAIVLALLGLRRRRR